MTVDLENWDRPDVQDLDEMRRVSPERMGLKVLLVIGVVGVVFSSIVSTVGVILIRETQTQNTPISKDTHSLVEYVKDCQDPKGDCAKQNQKQLASLLSNVDKQNRRVSAAAASCSLGVPPTLPESKRYQQILRCTQATLNALGPTQTQ